MSQFIINTEIKLKEKLELIQNLVDIQVAHDITKNMPSKSKATSITIPEVHPLDESYQQLKCKITTIKQNTDDFKMISKYIENGKGNRRLTLVDCFKIERESEDKIYNP
jgi:hypothetical protein